MPLRDGTPVCHVYTCATPLEIFTALCCAEISISNPPSHSLFLRKFKRIRLIGQQMVRL